MVAERRQHRDEPIISICEGENAEVVEDVCSVRDGGEQPLEDFLIDALREEGDDSEKPSGVGSEFLEHRRGERKLDSGSEAPVVLDPKHIYPSSLPLPGESVGVPLAVMGNGSKQRD